MTIQAHVWEGGSTWEGDSIRLYLALIYALVFFGLITLGMVIRDYRLVNYGLSSTPSTSSRELTAEQIEPIRQALEDGKWSGLTAAIDRYREAVPDAELSEARQYVVRLFLEMRRQHPEKFPLPPLSLATLNWKGFLICALIEAAVLGVLWFVMPPSHPASAVSQFAYSLLFGMGLMAGTRVKGYRKLLLLAPSLVVMVYSETIVPQLAEATSHGVAPYLCGFFFGIFLVISAFLNPRAARS
jgi:hypothetical protein